MNKQGFTLTELLAVVVIIGLISGIAGFSYTKIMNDQKIKECEQKIEFIEKQAIKYANDNPSLLHTSNSYSVTIDALKTNGYLIVDAETGEDDVKNPVKGTNFSKSVKLTKNNGLITAKYGTETDGVNDDCK